MDPITEIKALLEDVVHEAYACGQGLGFMQSVEQDKDRILTILDTLIPAPSLAHDWWVDLPGYDMRGEPMVAHITATGVTFSPRPEAPSLANAPMEPEKPLGEGKCPTCHGYGVWWDGMIGLESQCPTCKMEPEKPLGEGLGDWGRDWDER